MTDRPLILLTNDDGIDSPGLRAAAEAVAPLGELLIVAPYYQQSASGRSFSRMPDRKIYRKTLTIAGQSLTGYSIKGTPAQSAITAILDLAPRPVSLVVSGINFGENLGSGITASGTVGAALEAASTGVPALAVSLETPQEYYMNPSDDIDFSAALHFTRHFAQRTLALGALPPDVDVLKIDVPASATTQTEWRMTTVSRQLYHKGLPSPPEKRGLEVDPSYRVSFERESLERESDIWAVAVDQIVSVAPVSINLSSRISLDAMLDRFNGHH